MIDARELFEEARRAARRIPAIRAELDAINDTWRRCDWPVVGCGGGYNDPTAGTATHRMGATRRLESELATLTATVDEARALVSGVGALLGESYAAALTYRYMEARQWADVAVLLGVSDRTAYSRVTVALDTIDGLGRRRVLEGQGVAAV